MSPFAFFSSIFIAVELLMLATQAFSRGNFGTKTGRCLAILDQLLVRNFVQASCIDFRLPIRLGGKARY
jgi:hypothetical protein